MLSLKNKLQALGAKPKLSRAQSFMNRGYFPVGLVIITIIYLTDFLPAGALSNELESLPSSRPMINLRFWLQIYIVIQPIIAVLAMLDKRKCLLHLAILLLAVASLHLVSVAYDYEFDKSIMRRDEIAEQMLKRQETFNWTGEPHSLWNKLQSFGECCGMQHSDEWLDKSPFTSKEKLLPVTCCRPSHLRLFCRYLDQFGCLSVIDKILFCRTKLSLIVCAISISICMAIFSSLACSSTIQTPYSSSEDIETSESEVSMMEYRATISQRLAPTGRVKLVETYV